MFETVLIESDGRIRTRSRSFAAVSFVVQSGLAITLVLLPLLRPQSLPRLVTARLLIAPPLPPLVPAAPRHEHASIAPPLATDSLVLALQAKPLIGVNPRPAFTASEPARIETGFGSGPVGVNPSGILASIPMTAVVAKPPSPPRNLHVSSGVAAGLLLTPIQPRYPEIAKQARIAGTVVLDAFISKEGKIEDLNIVEGPQLLRQAALEAVMRARYRPYTLNGEAVGVQTTIRIVFTLGG